MSDQKVIANILRVDHAGEYGAIRIYEAQRFLARGAASDIIAFLDRTLDDERRHRDVFEALMRQRKITPCRTLSAWGVGGYLLGLMTGVLGRSAILICTEAVERTVHRHLEDQVSWLERRDPEILATIVDIQRDELEHLRFAETQGAPGRRTGGARTLERVVVAATEALIWLSTYGASSRMARGIAP